MEQIDPRHTRRGRGRPKSWDGNSRDGDDQQLDEEVLELEGDDNFEMATGGQAPLQDQHSAVLQEARGKIVGGASCSDIDMDLFAGDDQEVVINDEEADHLLATELDEQNLKQELELSRAG